MMAAERERGVRAGYVDKPVELLDEEDFDYQRSEIEPPCTQEERNLLLGYTEDPSRRVVVRDNGDTFVTALHEKYHQVSAGRLPTELNEGITEHLAGRKAGAIGELIKIGPHGEKLPDHNRTYDLSTRAAEKLEAGVGSELMKRAYFEEEVAPLKQATDREFGDGTYDRLVVALRDNDAAAVDRLLVPRRRRDL